MKGFIFSIITVLLLFSVSISCIPVSFGHISKTFGNTSIGAGWLNEPPLVSDMNSLIIKVSKVTGTNETAILNAVANLSLSVKYGTIIKELDFTPSQTIEGGYEGEIIPTRVGPFSIILKGDVKGQKK